MPYYIDAVKRMLQFFMVSQKHMVFFPFQAPEDGNYDDGRVRFPLMIMALEARTFKSKFADFRETLFVKHLK